MSIPISHSSHPPFLPLVTNSLLYEIIEKQSKSMTTESRSVFAKGRAGEGEECRKGSWGNFGSYGNVFHLDCVSGCIAIDICQNSLNCTLKMDVCPLLDIYPKKMKTLIWKDICTSMFIIALFIIAKIRKQPKCQWMDEWIKKWHTHTHTHIYICVCIYMCIYIYTHTHTHTHTKWNTIQL